MPRSMLVRKGLSRGLFVVLLAGSATLLQAQPYHVPELMADVKAIVAAARAARK